MVDIWQQTWWKWWFWYNFFKLFKSYRIKFSKKNRTYQTINKNEYVGEISKIIFNIKNEKIRLDNNILIYTLNAKGNKNLIYKKKFSGYFNKKEITNINHKTDKFNSEKYPIYIEIEDLQNELLNNISSISLILKNKYILNDYKIIEQKDNCYYVNKWNISNSNSNHIYFFYFLVHFIYL